MEFAVIADGSALLSVIIVGSFSLYRYTLFFFIIEIGIVYAFSYT